MAWAVSIQSCFQQESRISLVSFLIGLKPLILKSPEGRGGEREREGGREEEAEMQRVRKGVQCSDISAKQNQLPHTAQHSTYKTVQYSRAASKLLQPLCSDGARRIDMI